MNIGEVIRTKKVRAVMPDGKSWVEFLPNSGGVQVFLYLGNEPLKPKDEERINPNEWLKAMGWKPPPKPKISWKDITPEAKKLAKKAKKVHEAGTSHSDNIGGVQHSDIRFTAKDIGVDGRGLRSLGAKRNRPMMERAFSNVGLVLKATDFDKHAGATNIVLMVA